MVGERDAQRALLDREGLPVLVRTPTVTVAPAGTAACRMLLAVDGTTASSCTVPVSAALLPGPTNTFVLVTMALPSAVSGIRIPPSRSRPTSR